MSNQLEKIKELIDRRTAARLMGSDILYEPKMQRCIGVDVRYILFMIERYGKAGNLIRELKIASGG